MNCVSIKYGDHYAILDDDADFIVGRVHPLDQGGFRVSADLAPDWGDSVVGVVQTFGDAIPALIAYYKRNPPQWRREDAMRYAKFTQFAFLRVAQDETGNWLPNRDGYPMLRNGKPAIFATREEAQRAADAHLLDYYPNCEVVDDGLSWVADPEIDWRSCPHRVEARSKLQRVVLVM